LIVLKIYHFLLINYHLLFEKLTLIEIIIFTVVTFFTVVIIKNKIVILIDMEKLLINIIVLFIFKYILLKLFQIYNLLVYGDLILVQENS
jgi:hypothetical protein